jgi:hypothetical protein
MTSGLLDKLRRSGCVCLAYGIESGSQRVLDLMKKGFRIKDAQEVIRDTSDAGIAVVANFMFGFPGETDEDFEETLNFIFENKKRFTSLNPSPAYTAIGIGTYLFNHREEYDLDLGPGSMHWRTKDGKNTFATRKERYETFCNFASSLGINFNYPVTKKLA